MVNSDIDLINAAKDHSKLREVAIAEEDIILKPLLEDIDLLEDERLKEFVRAVLYAAPGQFWTMPSSFKDFCPPDERKAGGQVLHTRRAIRVFILLSDAQDRKPQEVDFGLAALLMHAILRGGAEPNPDVEQLNMYDVIDIDQWLRQLRATHMQTKPEETGHSSSAALGLEEFEVVSRMVRVHLGRFAPIPELLPIIQTEWDVHLSYYLSSSLHWLLDGDNQIAKRWGRAARTRETKKNG